MKQTYKIFLFALMAIIALVVGSLVVRQAGMIPHEELLHPTPFPTNQISLTITVTIRPEIALLSQGIGSILQETVLAAEGTKITPIDALSPTPIPYTVDMSPIVLSQSTDRTQTTTATLCLPSDVICATMSPADKVMVLMSSASAPEFGQLAQTATALAVTSTPLPTIDMTNVSLTNESFCAWSWATRDLPDTAQAVQAALVKAGITNVQIIHASAFGEECGNRPRSAHNFGAMNTDFHLNATVHDFNDVHELGKIIADAYTVITTLNIEYPAPPGYLEITFISGGETKPFRVLFSVIKVALEAGKIGAELVALNEW